MIYYNTPEKEQRQDNAAQTEPEENPCKEEKRSSNSSGSSSAETRNDFIEEKMDELITKEGARDQVTKESNGSQEHKPKRLILTTKKKHKKQRMAATLEAWADSTSFLLPEQKRITEKTARPGTRIRTRTEKEKESNSFAETKPEEATEEVKVNDFTLEPATKEKISDYWEELLDEEKIATPEKELLEKGADPNLENSGKVTAVDTAAKQSSLAINLLLNGIKEW
jgi:hypothetical protein